LALSKNHSFTQSNLERIKCIRNIIEQACSKANYASSDPYLVYFSQQRHRYQNQSARWRLWNNIHQVGSKPKIFESQKI